MYRRRARGGVKRRERKGEGDKEEKGRERGEGEIVLRQKNVRCSWFVLPWKECVIEHTFQFAISTESMPSDS